jgi:hypothetical protein
VIRLALWLLAAQTPADREERTLVVYSDTLEVAREAYALGPARLPGGSPGWVLSATARYAKDRPVVVFSPTLEIGADSVPVSLQFDVANPREPSRVLGQLGRNRFSLRILSRDLERAREFPVRSPFVILDDDILSFYEVAAWFGGPSSVEVIAIFARVGRREVLTLVESGTGPVSVRGRTVEARHLTLVGGVNQLVHVWVDAAGRLARVAIPSRKLVAESEPTN